MVTRNLDNVIGGTSSPMISIRVDKKAKDILKLVFEAGMNKSEFIRNAILEKYENMIKELKKDEK